MGSEYTNSKGSFMKKYVVMFLLLGAVSAACSMQHDRAQVPAQDAASVPVVREVDPAVSAATPVAELPVESPAVQVCSICMRQIGRRHVACDAFFQNGSPEHVFHERCLLRWLREGVSQTCPICRMPIKSEHPERKVTFMVDADFGGTLIAVHGRVSRFRLRTRAGVRHAVSEGLAIAHSLYIATALAHLQDILHQHDEEMQ